MSGIIPPGVLEFAEGQRLARLATVDERGRPHAVPICFAIDGDVLYTPIDEKPKTAGPEGLRRVQNIAANPHVQVLLDAYDDADWSSLRYVQLRGLAAIVAPGAHQHGRAISLLRFRYPQYRAMALETRPVIAVQVQRVVQWTATSPRT